MPKSAADERAARDMAGRLERVRTEQAGEISLAEFHRRLLEGWPEKLGDPVSYEAVRTYHYNRTAPPAYLARVAEVFDVRLAWLVADDGPMTREESRARETEPDLGDMVLAGFHEGFGGGKAALYVAEIGLSRSAILRTWTELAGGTVDALDLPQALGEALRAPFAAFGLDPNNYTAGAISKYVTASCIAFWHLKSERSLSQKEER